MLKQLVSRALLAAALLSQATRVDAQSTQLPVQAPVAPRLDSQVPVDPAVAADTILQGVHLPVPKAVTRRHFVRIPAGTMLPVALDTDVYTHALRAGDRVMMHTTQALKMPSGELLLPGTHLFGDVSAINTDSMFSKASLALSFDRMQLNDGTNFPVAAGLVMPDRLVSSILITPNCDMHLTEGQSLLLELVSPAQIAAQGNAM